MSNLSSEQIESLIQGDKIHRAVYSDPAIFELEMKQLFGKAWLLLGHESQVSKPGDYFCTEMARQPVIVSLHEDGSLNVLFNRCTHRGAKVCHEDKGNAKQFVCPYHGWSFENNGNLRFVPLAQNYGTDPTSNPNLNLAPVGRVDTYRGFIFASLASEGLPLLEFLGNITTSFDDLVDRSPTGEIEIAGGVFKHAYNGNWKLVLENHNDTVHPAFVHASSVYAASAAHDAPNSQVADISIRQMRQNGASSEVWENLGLWTAGEGHSFMGDYHDDKRLVAGAKNPVFEEYAELLTARIGEERTHDVLSVSRFNSIVYPELLIHEPVPPVAHRASDLGGQNGRLHLFVQDERRSCPPLRRHDCIRQRGERNGIVGAHRRSGSLRTRAGRTRRSAERLGLHRTRLRRRQDG